MAASSSSSLSSAQGGAAAAAAVGDAVYRTTPARTAKMMAIMLGICIAGGGIFFGMWDYWISQPPPVVALMAGDEAVELAEVELTGVEISVDLSFVESEDFRIFSFNAQPGDPDRNPTIEANPGDRILFNVVNDGISFHSFGVTADEEGTGGIFPGSEIGIATNPLSNGQSGTSEFVAPEDGIYYYICTVPGHRAQGMVGLIVVGDVDASEAEAAAAEEPAAPPAAAPAVDRVVVEGFEGAISMPEGSSVAGCEETDECYIPAGVSVAPGSTVTWSNDDTAAHTVTSSPESPMEFNSGLFMPGETYDVTFDDPGEYPYLCIVHPWMTGVVVVDGDAGSGMAPAEDDDGPADSDMSGTGGGSDSGMAPAEDDDGPADSDMSGTGGGSDSGMAPAEDDDGPADSDMSGTGGGGGMGDALAIGDSVTIVKTPAVSSGAPAGEEGAGAGAGSPAGPISIPEGTSIAGCERTDECYIPSSVTVPAGSTVTWSNDDTAAHTVTSSPESPMEFNSDLFLAGATYEVTFDDPGEYPYLCIVHPWMIGTVIVE